MTWFFKPHALGALAAVLVGACTGGIEDQVGTLELDNTAPSATNIGRAPVYTGSNDFVVEAQAEFRTALDLHRKIIVRTCGNTVGVCHNTKEYPDLHTPANFIRAVAAPCNVQPRTPEAVFDRCEPTGDKLRLTGDDGELFTIGWVNHIPGVTPDLQDEQRAPGPEEVGLHINLLTPISMSDDAVRRQDEFNPRRRTAEFLRDFQTENAGLETLEFASVDLKWWILDDGRRLFGEVTENRTSTVENIVQAGVQQGDWNRNGIFGAETLRSVQMFEPNNPQGSYLIARLRGFLFINGESEEVPGTRMPLANEPLSIPDMLALMCWVRGLPTDGDLDRINLESAIDYVSCPESQDPENLNLLGEGATWASRVLPLLQDTCGGCHGATDPSGDWDIMSEGAYARILQASTQVTSLNLIEPGNPENSYLYLKIIGDPSIVGSRMPNTPGGTFLSESSAADIRTWIENGALELE